MNDEGKLVNARAGAQQLVSLLDESDTFSFLPFNNESTWVVQNARLADARPAVLEKLGNVFAGGGTALYDSLAAAYDFQLQKTKANTGRISAIVVLTDGADTHSKLALNDLLARIRGGSEGEGGGIRIFTIGYGQDAEKKVLEGIAEASQARFYAGTPENIRTVFREISTFF